jgi:type IV secretion system protein VirB10
MKIAKILYKCFWLFILAGILTAPLRAQTDQQPAQEPKQLPEPELVVPVGTVIPIVLNTYLNTKSTQVGDIFYADTVYPIWIQQRLIIPRGSIIKGTVTEVFRPGVLKGKGKIAVRFDSVLLPNGVERQLVANFHGIHGPGAEKIDRKTETVQAGGTGNAGSDVGTVVGTAGNGAIIGSIGTRDTTGTLIGAGAGAAAGVAIVLLSRDRHLILEPGIQLDLQLMQPLRFAYNDVMFTQAEMERAVRKPPASGRQQQSRRPSTVPSRLPGIILPRIIR